MVRTLKCLFVALIASVVWAGDQDWNFVWVSSGQNRYEVVRGKAKVTITGGKLNAELKGEDGNEFKVVGQVAKHKVNAKFTVVGSDYFVDSPFSGTFTSKHWSGIQGSSGRESISLNDGWNFLGFSRELP